MARAKRTTGAQPERAATAGWGQSSRLLWGIGSVALGTGLCAASFQSILESRLAADSLLSPGLWKRLVEHLGGRLSMDEGRILSGVPFASALAVVALISAVAWLSGAWWIARRRQLSFAAAAAEWGALGWIWSILAGSWEVVCLAFFAARCETSYQFLRSVPIFWMTAGAAGWLATYWALARRNAIEVRPSRPERDDFRVSASVWLCYASYVVVFVAMNWQLYRGLLLPHGDSAMYEEHLWNLLHGKGFRSYLDQGLFLGEHVQVIHLLLIPLYVLWPSQMMLELCGSVILAAGCIPVFWLARRHAGSERTAAWLAAAYLLYFPTQFLDIAIDLKTFRPNGLGIPVLLFALDQLERRRYKTFCLLAVVTLSAQEDYAIVLAPLGVWIAARQARAGRSSAILTEAASTTERKSPRRFAIFGVCLAILAAAYLLLATRLIIPWFRNWQEIHYARYFTKFGNTLTEIAWNITTDPRLLFDELVTLRSTAYVLAILVPLGFLPLFSPGRLAVAFPLLVTLCLNELAVDPRHHFHAPLVPILFWSAAAGLPVASRIVGRAAKYLNSTDDAAEVQLSSGWWARFACFGALVSGVFFGLSPLSVAFWDSDSPYFWRRLYVPGRRAELFARVFEEIPLGARVASTDFVHPRFTHYARSYDYSDYPRAVNNNQPGAPPDTDYIVIDTQHEYSEIKRPEQIREYREHPEDWEVLPDRTEGYFIVLKRKRPSVRG